MERYVWMDGGGGGRQNLVWITDDYSGMNTSTDLALFRRASGFDISSFFIANALEQPPVVA